MLSTQLKSDIQKLWDAFWAGGLSNPLTAIEQITYLVFLKRLEDLDNEAVQQKRRQSSIFDRTYQLSDGQSHAGDLFRWSKVRLRTGDDLFTFVRGPVFEWMKQMDDSPERDRMRDAVFLIPNARLLTQAMGIINDLFIQERNQDTLGDIYEYLLGEIAVAGKNGQFRTPRHIIRAMCDLVDPQYGERICDPACGTGGFLINAYQHILKSHTSPDILRFAADGTPINAIGDQLTPDQHAELRRNHLHGFDFDRTMMRLGWMNLIQHGLENPDIHYADTLGSRFNERVAEGGDLRGAFDVVLANPPFTGSIDANDIGPTLRPLNTRKTELLFVELILQLLRPGGRAAVIVPEGVLFDSSRAHKALRQKLVAENELQAVISLPGGVFYPYAGVKTSILLFARGGQTDGVWFYEIRDDGFSLTTKRTEQYAKNDLWDMTLKSRLRFAANYRQPCPAFVDGDTWRQWQAFDAESRRSHYIQPGIRSVTEEIGTEPVEIQGLRGLTTNLLRSPKDWSATRDSIAGEDGNLTASRHKEFVAPDMEYPEPAEIITELADLELQIQQGLNDLLEMIGGGDE